jgi:hypothetical protein
MSHLDEGTIHAWLDGALSPEESARVESHARECAECAARVAEARGFIAGASRIVSSLDVVRGNVIPASAAASKRSSSLWAKLRFTPARAAIAATILVGVASMFTVRSQRDAFKVEPAPAPMPVAASASPPAAAPATAAAKTTAPSVPAPSPSPAEGKPAQRDVAREEKAAPADTRRAAVDSVSTSALAERITAQAAPGKAANAAGLGGAAPSSAVADAPPATRSLRRVPVAQPALEGCYRISGDTAFTLSNLPQRFRLYRDSTTGRNVVSGAADSVLDASAWRVLSNGSVVVSFDAGRSDAVQVSFGGDATSGLVMFGGRTVSARVERVECRPPS